MPHEEFLGLGRTLADCAKSWSAFVEQGIRPDDLARMRKQFTRNRPLGSPAFEKNPIGDVFANTSPKNDVPKMTTSW